MKQSSKSPLNPLINKLLPHLRHPTKLRFILCVTIVGGWYLLFFAPLSDQVAETKTLIDKERKRVTVAREIEQLKVKLKPYEASIPRGTDATDLRRYLSAHIRSTPLRLIDLKPGKGKEIGPFNAPALQLSIEGKYKDIDELLAWVENDKWLLRVDSIKLAPASKDESRLVANLVVLGLTERPTADLPESETTTPAATKERGAAVAPASKNAKGSSAPTGVKTTPKAGEPRKSVGEVRKKVSDVRKKIDEARANTNPPANPPVEKAPVNSPATE
jgi:hypothetical protein